MDAHELARELHPHLGDRSAPHGLGQFLVPFPGVLRVIQWCSILAELSSVVVLWLRGRALLAAAVFWLGFRVFTVALLSIHFAPTVVCWLAFAPLERLVAWWRARHATLEPPVPIPPRAVAQLSLGLQQEA